jgi:hypothetical protein
MIAMKDQDGYVRGDARTIARMANVSVEMAEDALKRFQEPDPMSRTPDHDGRRIAPFQGGWILLNHDKYTEIGMSEALKAYWRDRKKKLRSEKLLGLVSDMSKNVSVSSTSTSVSDSASLGEGVQGEGGEVQEFPQDFIAFWAEYPKKKGKLAALKAWKNAKTKPALEAIISAVKLQKTWPDWMKDGGQYIPMPSTWLNQGRWDDRRTIVQRADGNI